MRKPRLDLQIFECTSAIGNSHHVCALPPDPEFHSSPLSWKASASNFKYSPYIGVQFLKIISHW